jgi:hypothetical protein
MHLYSIVHDLQDFGKLLRQQQLRGHRFHKPASVQHAGGSGECRHCSTTSAIPMHMHIVTTLLLLVLVLLLQLVVLLVCLLLLLLLLLLQLLCAMLLPHIREAVSTGRVMGKCEGVVVVPGHITGATLPARHHCCSQGMYHGRRAGRHRRRCRRDPRRCYQPACSHGHCC